MRGRKEALLALLAAALILGTASSSASALPVITVTPNAGLASPATVQVSGTGWPAASQLQIRQCTGDSIFSPSDCTAPLALVDADGAGSFGPVAVTVTRTFVDEFTGATTDCGAIVCVVRTATGSSNISSVAIGFAPPPPATAPTETPTTAPEPTGRRAAAIKRCKNRFEKSNPKRKRCVSGARKLPV